MCDIAGCCQLMAVVYSLVLGQLDLVSCHPEIQLLCLVKQNVKYIQLINKKLNLKGSDMCTGLILVLISRVWLNEQ